MQRASRQAWAPEELDTLSNNACSGKGVGSIVHFSLTALPDLFCAYFGAEGLPADLTPEELDEKDPRELEYRFASNTPLSCMKLHLTHPHW